MAEMIGEPVSVDLVSNHLTHRTYPWCMRWRGRKYVIRQVGLHHTVHDGRTLVHIFSVTDGISSFRLSFDTESLGWKLEEIESHMV